jgi:hypothetical protein
MERKLQAALSLWHDGIFDWEGGDLGLYQVEGEPISIVVLGPDWNNGSDESFILPVITEGYVKNTAIRSLLPDGMRSDGFEEVFDEMLKSVLGLAKKSILGDFLKGTPRDRNTELNLRLACGLPSSSCTLISSQRRSKSRGR